MTATNQTLTDKRAQRLARNELIRQRNRERAAANELRPRRFMTTIVIDGYKPREPELVPLPPKSAVNPDWLICPVCESGISETDLEAEECTNCHQTLCSVAAF